MPIFIPILLGGAALGAAAAGVTKAVKGVSAMREAKRIGSNAQRRHERAVKKAVVARDRFSQRVSRFDKRKQVLLGSTVERLMRFLEQLEQSARVAAFERLGKLTGSQDEVRKFAAQYFELGGTASGAMISAMTGSAASTLTTGAVTAAATTAGGTAISGLSGAALNSAVMAWLGGGSLAAGGFGMAGGAVVLGGITVAPALLVGGFVLAREGAKAQTKAIKFAAQADKKIAEIDAALGFLEKAGTRVAELSLVLSRLNRRASAALDRLWELDGAFDAADDDHVKRFATAMQLVKAMTDVMRAPILDKDGSLDSQTTAMLEAFFDNTKEASA